MYTGKTGRDPQKGVAYNVVKQMEGLEGKGYNLFMENWYSSPPLFIDLEKKKILACGTVSDGRKGLPGDIMNIKRKEMKSMKSGQSVFRQKGRLTACLWKESRFVHLLTTMPATSEFSEATRSIKEKGKWVQKEVQRRVIIRIAKQMYGRSRFC